MSQMRPRGCVYVTCMCMCRARAHASMCLYLGGLIYPQIWFVDTDIHIDSRLHRTIAYKHHIIAFFHDYVLHTTMLRTFPCCTHSHFVHIMIAAYKHHIAHNHIAHDRIVCIVLYTAKLHFAWKVENLYRIIQLWILFCTG